MGKFRKITNIINAVKWNGDIQEIENIQWIQEAIQKQILIFGVNDEKDKEAVCLLDRGNDIERVYNGDYIINEGKEINIISGKVFEETYEQVMCYQDKIHVVVNLEMDNKIIAKHVNEAIKNINRECKMVNINAEEVL